MSYYLHHVATDSLELADIRGGDWPAIQVEFAALTSSVRSSVVALWSLDGEDAEFLTGALEALWLPSQNRVLMYESTDPSKWWARLPEWVQSLLLENPRRIWDSKLDEELSGTTGWHASRVATQSAGGLSQKELGLSGRIFVEYFRQLTTERQREILRS